MYCVCVFRKITIRKREVFKLFLLCFGIFVDDIGEHVVPNPVIHCGHHNVPHVLK